MVLVSHLKLSASLAEDGRWITFHGSRFRVRHWSYGPFQERLAELQIELAADDQNLNEDGNLKAEHQAWAIRQALAEHLIADWADMEVAPGEPWELTDEARAEFAHASGWRPATDAVYAASKTFSSYTEAAAEKAAGNSSGS